MARRGYTKGIKKLLLLYVLSMCILEGMSLYFPMLLQDITSIAEHQYDGNGSVTPIVLQGLLVFAFITGLFVMQFLAERFGSVYMDKYQQNMRLQLFEKFSRLGQEQIDHIGIARIMPIMLNDTNWLKKLHRQTIIFCVYFPVAILGSFIMLFNLDIVYALFALASLPIVLVFFWWNSHRIAAVIPDSVNLNDELYIAIKEGVTGAKEIRTLGKAEERHQEFRRYVSANRFQAFRTNRSIALSTAFNAILFTLITIAIVIYGASTADDITGVVILNTSVQYINRIWTGSHQIFVWFVDFLPRGTFTNKRLNKYYAMPEEPRPTGFESIPAFKHNRIRIDGVTYVNGNGKRELNNISIDIAAGECTAIAGASDSGKSALKNILMRSVDPTKGTVTFNDIDIQQMNINTWRRDFISFCDSTPQFIPGTVRENMQLLAPNVTDEEILQAFRDIGANEFIKNFQGILDFEIVENSNISGGMQNILNIVRCILKPAHLYIFNQCFEHIKKEYIVKLMNWVRREGKTALFVTYNSTVCTTSDIIHVMQNGAIVACGKNDELLRKCPAYRALDITIGGAIVEELNMEVPS